MERVRIEDPGHLENVGEILVDRLVPDETEVLVDHATAAAEERHLGLGDRVGVELLDLDPSLRRPLFERHEFEKGGLPRTAGAQEKDHLSRRNLEGQIVENPSASGSPILLEDMIEPDHWDSVPMPVT